MTYSECVFVVLRSSIQRACAISPSVAYPSLPNFAIYLLNGTILDKTLLNKKCVFWFCL